MEILAKLRHFLKLPVYNTNEIKLHSQHLSPEAHLTIYEHETKLSETLVCVCTCVADPAVPAVPGFPEFEKKLCHLGFESSALTL